MKVLMIRQEYTSNRSGGLGNACYNLTNGQMKLKDVVVTFVVPTLSRGDYKPNIKLFGAYDVSVIDLKINVKIFHQVQRFMNVSSTPVHRINPADNQQQSSCHAERPHSLVKIDQYGNVKFPGKYDIDLFPEISRLQRKDSVRGFNKAYRSAILLNSVILN